MLRTEKREITLNKEIIKQKNDKELTFTLELNI